MTESTLGRERLARFLYRAAAGEELTVAFFGGSITQGSLASKEALCYARRVFDLLAERFPQAVLHYVNAGIGGTGSHFGAMRVWDDLLMYRPDLVIIDFSVNDTEAVLPLYDAGTTEARGRADWSRRAGDADAVVRPQADTGTDEMKLYPETFEAVLRCILASETMPAAVVLNNAFYDTGESVEDEHNAIANHYGVPHVSVRDTILPRIRAGEYAREELSPDGLHPNDRGHELIAREILHVLDAVALASVSDGLTGDGDELSDVGELARLDGATDVVAQALPAPRTANTYERTMRYTIANCAPGLAGFRADSEEKTGHLDFFKNGWIGQRVGDRMTLTLDGRNLAVVYRKTIRRPSPVAKLVLDGDETHPVVLDGNFDQDWGDCLFLQPILHHGAPGKHRIEIEITQATPGDANPFYLLAFGASV